MRLRLVGFVIATAFMMTGCGSNDPQLDRPLGVGDSIPKISYETISGKTLKLQDAVSEKPTVLIYYRGSWCPYCSNHLKELRLIERELTEQGFQLLAVSPDKPSELSQTLTKHSMAYQLLSDSKMTGAKALGIAFKVDAAIAEQLRSYGIDLEGASGHNHHLLPHPAVFIIDQQGTIVFAYVNQDYKVRLSASEILTAIQNWKAR